MTAEREPSVKLRYRRPAASAAIEPIESLADTCTPKFLGAVAGPGYADKSARCSFAPLTGYWFTMNGALDGETVALGAAPGERETVFELVHVREGVKDTVTLIVVAAERVIERVFEIETAGAVSDDTTRKTTRRDISLWSSSTFFFWPLKY